MSSNQATLPVMIAELSIMTPLGPRQTKIEFGQGGSDAQLKAWRTPSQHSRRDLAHDSIELAKLAGKRWRYYHQRNESATSLDGLRSRIKAHPNGEIGFLLFAKPLWRPSPSVLAVAWCRRTWCNHIVLDFLAVHPLLNDPLGGYKGMGSAMLIGIAAVARTINCPLVWGEATETSSTFYQKLLGGTPVMDHFFFSDEVLRSLSRQLVSQPDAGPSKP